MALTIAEKKARYEQSALKQLMDAAEHEICKRCYCCDVVSKSAPCWSCGGFQDEFDDWDGFPPDVCSECGGEGKLYWKECIGRCDENGNHATLTHRAKLRRMKAENKRLEGETMSTTEKVGHTPGPWGFALESPSLRPLRFKRPHWRLGSEENGRLGIAIVFGDDDANARLIAAAPELLEALKALMKAITPELTGVPKNVPKSSWAKEWDACEAAIRKAEGQS